MVWNLTPLSYCLHSTPVISTLQNNSLGVRERGSHCKTKSWKKQNLSYYGIIIHCVIHNAMRNIKEIASRASAFILSCGIISNRLFPCEHVCFVAVKARETVGRVPVFVIKAVLCSKTWGFKHKCKKHAWALPLSLPSLCTPCEWGRAGREVTLPAVIKVKHLDLSPLAQTA